ncbi:conserved exonuclease [Babesia caballi]|uniref:Conserved exonuclease n=1 Tax=Babesia caballi TaxID=5871 RepID=A0AAV4LYB2_BABCB|nr:conserved exonuclease [Babesia caballi]
MEGCGGDTFEWEDVSWLNRVAGFCCLNEKVIDGWPPVYVVTFNFILENLYDVYLREIREYALVDLDVFASFFSTSLDRNAPRHSTGDESSEPSEPAAVDRESSFEVDSGIACLLEDENLLLHQSQKRIVKAMLRNGADAVEPRKLKFHMYVGQVEGKLHMVQCTCCAYELADILVEILSDYDECRKKRNRKMMHDNRVTTMMKRIMEQFSRIIDADRIDFGRQMVPDKLWDARDLLTVVTIHQNAPKAQYLRLIGAASVMTLYTLMPHDLAVKCLGRLMKNNDHKTLIELCALIDRLLINFPKEFDVWDLKLYLTKEFLSRMRNKGPDMMDGVELLFGRHRMDIEGVLLQISAKARMNSRMPWFLGQVYDSVKKMAVNHLPATKRCRVFERLDDYFIRLYANLLVANNGYQGVFHLHLRLVRGHPSKLNGLREICESAEPNDSWIANLDMLNKVTA